MRRILAAVVAIALAIVALSALAKSRAAARTKPLSVTRSFIITDISIVSTFTLDRVLEQLIARSGVTDLTAPQLLRQMFDTQNPKPGLADPAGPHCDDTLVNGQPSFNGFPRRCPTPEGAHAAAPHGADDYFAIGIANRFDMMPADGANCGQYRLMFAKRQPATDTRLHLIFEAVLPNPNPSAGIAGCRPVAQFWADLSNIDSMELRRERLEQFFFDGLPGFAPVVDAAHYRDGSAGIRTMQQVPGRPSFRFYQFRLQKDCSSGECTLRFMPDVLENVAFARYFDATNDSAQARAFRDEFIRQIPTLAIRDLNGFFMTIPREYLMGEMRPLDNELTFAYSVFYQTGNNKPGGGAFRDRIRAELTRIGSTLTADNIIQRAEHQTCSGCHGFNGINFGEGVKLGPGFFSIQMVSEDIMEDGEGGPKTRYGVDPIITDQFIPQRMQILRDFLTSGKAPVRSN